MKICICGGGALGTVCAGVFSSLNNIEVNILTKHPERWTRVIKINDINGKAFEGELSIISNNPATSIRGCDIILLCLPGHLIKETLIKIKPYLNNKTIVGSIVSNTGFFFQAHTILHKDAKLFGFQRVPFIARIIEYGHEAALLGYKTSLNVAVENIENIDCFREIIEKLFLTPINILNNFYEACLTNSNPILHTGRLYRMWHDWDGEAIPECSFFYKEWDDESSQIVLAMDREFMELLSYLPVDKRQIPTLLEYYESYDTVSLTKKISSIPAFQCILSPMRQTKDGWIPDFESRYFIEDFLHGLFYIRNLALQHDVQTPTIDEIYNWGINSIAMYVPKEILKSYMNNNE